MLDIGVIGHNYIEGNLNENYQQAYVGSVLINFPLG